MASYARARGHSPAGPARPLTSGTDVDYKGQSLWSACHGGATPAPYADRRGKDRWNRQVVKATPSQLLTSR